MRTLPEALQVIDVPDRVAASSLGGWAGCVAKLALASQRLEPGLVPLPGGPAAAKGILAHRVLEQWIKGKGPDEPAALFAAVYAQLREELGSDPCRASFAELADVLGAAEWSGFRAWVLRQCEAAGRHSFDPSSKLPTNGAQNKRLTGVEVELASGALRVKGRADRVRRLSADTYEIRDFKSGAVLDDDGGVEESIALQLQAYGLMFLEAEPGAKVVLVVDIGKEISVAFDEAARGRARDRIEALLESVPAAGRHALAKITKPGTDCLGCLARHQCKAYIAQAPSWWLAYPEKGERVSHDSWGTVTAASHGVGGVDVTLEDAAGRRIRIDRLDRRHGITASHIGRVLWLFDLESSGPAMNFKGQRFHPRVFHELPRDRRERRAWRAQVFLGPDGGGSEHRPGAVTPRA